MKVYREGIHRPLCEGKISSLYEDAKERGIKDKPPCTDKERCDAHLDDVICYLKLIKKIEKYNDIVFPWTKKTGVPVEETKKKLYDLFMDEFISF